MSDQTGEDFDRDADSGADQEFRSADMLAVLAVASFLSAVGLVTFFVTTTLGG